MVVFIGDKLINLMEIVFYCDSNKAISSLFLVILVHVLMVDEKISFLFVVSRKFKVENMKTKLLAKWEVGDRLPFVFLPCFATHLRKTISDKNVSATKHVFYVSFFALILEKI